MALSNKKLYFKRSGTTYSCNLYTTQQELLDCLTSTSNVSFLCVRAGNETLYALIGLSPSFKSGISATSLPLYYRKSNGTYQLYNVVVPQGVTYTLTIKTNASKNIGITKIETSTSNHPRITFYLSQSNSYNSNICSIILSANALTATNSIYSSNTKTTVYIWAQISGSSAYYTGEIVQSATTAKKTWTFSITVS